MQISSTSPLRVALARALGETAASAGGSTDRVQRAFWTGATAPSRPATVVSITTARAAQTRLRSL